MPSSAEIKKEIALGIYSAGLLNFGDFTFKSGIKSPMYMNLRNLGSHPKFLKTVSKAVGEIVEELQYDLLAGIPYGAIPLMMGVSLELEKSVIFPRKESKEYGMAKDIIGDFEAGQRVVVVDDLVTTGDSKIESMVPFDEAGLKVQDFVVILDYDRGASELLSQSGYTLHSVMTVAEAVDIIAAESLIDEDMHARAKEFLASLKNS